jgi:hypothetical protein
VVDLTKTLDGIVREEKCLQIAQPRGRGEGRNHVLLQIQILQAHEPFKALQRAEAVVAQIKPKERQLAVSGGVAAITSLAEQGAQPTECGP